MRLIDADKLKNYLWSEPLYSDSINDRTYIREHIDEMPTVDAIPIKWLYEQSDNPDRSDRFRNACDLVAMTWLEERKEE